MPSEYPVTFGLYGGDEALYQNITTSGNVIDKGNFAFTRAFYSPNTNAYELGYLSDGGSYSPPPFVGPRTSFTRAYYSPNTEVYELGYRGGYGKITVVNYFKNAIALATLFVNNSNNKGRARSASAESTQMTFAQKNTTRFKIAVALQTSGIVSRYLRTKLKEAIVSSINAITSNKQFARARHATANSIWYAQTRKATHHVRTSTAIAINYAFEGRVGHFYRYARAQVAMLTTNSKTFNRVKSVLATFIGMSSHDTPFTKLYRFATASFTNAISTTKNVRAIRRGTANQTVMATVTRQANHRRFGSATVTYEIGVSKFHTFFKMAIANLASLASFRKSKSVKVKVTSTPMATSAKIGKFKRIANAIVVNRAQEGKITAHFRYATTRAIGLITSIKNTKHNRFSTVLATMLTKASKTRKTKITATFANMAKGVKSHGFKKSAQAMAAQMVIALRIRTYNKTASTIQSAAATVTKSKGAHRRGTVTVTYEIGTSKANTFGRKAIATGIGLIRYGISMIMNVRSVENTQVQPVIESNFFVTPNNVDVVGNYTSENDQPGDFNEPYDPLGEDVVPT